MDKSQWEVEGIEDFSFYCCSDCTFTSKNDSAYLAHITSCGHSKSGGTKENYSKLFDSNNEAYHDTDISFEVKKESVHDYTEEYHESNETDDYENVDEKSESMLPVSKLKIELQEDHEVHEESDNDLKDFEPSLTKNYVDTKVKRKKSKESKTNKWQCSLCSEEFSRHRDLKMHNTMDKVYKCSLCSKEFCKQKTLRVHNRTIHANVPCKVCGMVFDNPAKLNRHTRTKHIVPQKCEICGKMIVANLKRHIIEAHGNKTVKPFKCDNQGCSFSALRQSNLDIHKARCQKKEDYYCKICNKLFPSSNSHNESQYIKHYKAEHNDFPPEYRDKEQYLCSECPEVFFNKSTFGTHVWNHKKQGKGLTKQFKCELCQLTINGRRNYVMHCEKVHDEIVPHFETIECNSCEETFRAPSFYIQHYQSSHGSVPPEYIDRELFVCDQCTQVFVTKISLSLHISNVHSDKHGKKCQFCEKVFKYNKNLKEHVASKHEKNTPFKCDLCDRSYGTKTKLNDHKNLVHQRVKCDECGKEVCNSFTLKRHKASVHGTNPKDAYQCERCPKFFSSQTNLDKHIVSKHNHE